jgi:hypothetical protein
MPGVSVYARVRPMARSEVGLENSVFTRGAHDIECFKDSTSEKYATSLDYVLDENSSQGESLCMGQSHPHFTVEFTHIIQRMFMQE